LSVSLYFDSQVQYAIARQLVRRDVDVLTARNDGTDAAPDEQILARATALGRVLFTRDNDFLAMARRQQREGVPFSGVIYAHLERLSIGRCVEDLELIAKVLEPEELANEVRYLPLNF